MAFKRGANLTALNLSGPHASTVYNEVEGDIIERLDAFNAWVEMSNAMNPQSILQQMRCTWICFTRFQRQFILRWHVGEGRWELDGVIAKKPDEGDGGVAAPPDGPPDGPLDSGGVDLTLNGGFFLPPPERQPRRARVLRGRRRRRPADQAAKRPAERPHAIAAAATRAANRIVLRTRVLLRTVRRTPRFGHTLSRFEASVAEMKAVSRLTRDTIRVLAHMARNEIARAIEGVRRLFIERSEPAPQAQSLRDPRRYEVRPGFTLILYTFEWDRSEQDRPEWDKWLFGKLEIEIEYPNWESWLFGEPVEDEQKVA